MTAPTEGSVLNSTVVFIDTILSGLSSVVLNSIGLTSNVSESISRVSSRSLVSCWQDLFSYDEFQVKLLQIFLFVLTFNLVSIYIAWRLYDKKIYETFMKPVTPKVIEDLKKSVSRLNLPKEHSPRV